MALQGNGNFVFDELTNYSSSLDYPTSSWHGITANYGIKMSHPPPQPTTAVIPTEDSLRLVNSSYGLDELLPFSLHSLDYTDRGSPLQNLKLASEQPRRSNFFNPNSQSNGNVSAEGSSCSEHSIGDPQSKSCARKRRIMANDKAREDLSINPCIGKNTEKESKSKRPKSTEATNEMPDLKSKAEQGANSSELEMNQNQSQQCVKPCEAPKDYIHVRARRGQATDSHSLAERVRREKISERMKLLQDLVPGCNKITGKAVMLDEIINYVQSLQHQVEFLSMKLEAVNPRLDFSMEGFISKDMHEPSSMSFASNSAITYPQFPQPEWAHMQVGLSCNIEEPNMGNAREHALKKIINGHLAPAQGCGDAVSQIPSLWDDELQSVVQLGLGQNIHPPFTPQRFQRSFSTTYSSNEQ